MIHPCTTGPQAIAATTQVGALPTDRPTVLLDFCAARARRNGGSRTVDTWELVSPAAGRAVSDWRVSRGLTITECARLARVSTTDWSRVECPSPHRIGRAFPIWRVLTWIMAVGGPKFHMNGLPKPGDQPGTSESGAPDGDGEPSAS